MTIRPVVITGEPVLHRRAEPVTVIDDEIRTLVADMFETMDAARGVGLAAPQVGVAALDRPAVLALQVRHGTCVL